jgi:hypothetical protein
MAAPELQPRFTARIVSTRALASLLAAIGFAVMLVSGLVLFFAPSGRISRLDEWAFAGLLRHDWLAVHIGFALLFVATGTAHLAFNWRAMRSHLAGQVPRGVRVGKEAVLALVLAALLAAAAIERWPPFDAIFSIHKSAKSGFEPAGGPGGPRRGQPFETE